MSREADINQAFSDFLESYPEMEREILICKFCVYEALGWEGSAKDVAKEMLHKHFPINGNMRCYINDQSA